MSLAKLYKRSPKQTILQAMDTGKFFLFTQYDISSTKMFCLICGVFR